jgi:hypothetical protein
MFLCLFERRNGAHTAKDDPEDDNEINLDHCLDAELLMTVMGVTAEKVVNNFYF